MPVYFCSLFIAFFFFEKRELSVLLISLGTFHVRNIGKVLVSAPRPSLMGNIVALSIVYKMETHDLPPLCQFAKSARIVHIDLEFSSSFSLLCLLHAYFLSQNIMTPLWLLLLNCEIQSDWTTFKYRIWGLYTFWIFASWTACHTLVLVVAAFIVKHLDYKLYFHGMTRKGIKFCNHFSY